VTHASISPLAIGLKEWNSTGLDSRWFWTNGDFRDWFLAVNAGFWFVLEMLIASTSAIGGIIAAPRGSLVYSKSLLRFMVATAHDVVNGVGVRVWYGHARNPVRGLGACPRIRCSDDAISRAHCKLL
jgi:hypothetical protein